MEPIVQHSGHRYWWSELERFRGQGDAPFTCLVWDTSGELTADERAAATELILGAGCRYVVCGGAECERWHDDFDMALAARAAHRDHPEPLVMTTWHSGETVEQVAEFFVLQAIVPEEQVLEHMVVQVGPDWDVQNELMVWVRAWVVHPSGIDAPDAG